MFNEKWQNRFLEMADHIATWSRDPSTKVGAVIVRPDRTVASVGYNGFPRGVLDSEGLLNDREQKYPRTVHAELNAILSAREPLHSYHLFVSPLHPCADCAGAIIQSGITSITCQISKAAPQWQVSWDIANDMFKQAGVNMNVWPTKSEELPW